MMSQFKNYLERIIITSLAVVLLSASIISWSILIGERHGIKNDTIVAEAKETSGQIKRGMVVFTGTILVIAEYFHLNDDN